MKSTAAPVDVGKGYIFAYGGGENGVHGETRPYAGACTNEFESWLLISLLPVEVNDQFGTRRST